MTITEGRTETGTDIVDRIKVIDCDTHVIEPYDLWTSRVSVEKWGDKVPHVRWDEKHGKDTWYFGEKAVSARRRLRPWPAWTSIRRTSPDARRRRSRTPGTRPSG